MIVARHCLIDGLLSFCVIFSVIVLKAQFEKSLIIQNLKNIKKVITRNNSLYFNKLHSQKELILHVCAQLLLQKTK